MSFLHCLHYTGWGHRALWTGRITFTSLLPSHLPNTLSTLAHCTSTCQLFIPWILALSPLGCSALSLLPLSRAPAVCFALFISESEAHCHASFRATSGTTTVDYEDIDVMHNAARPLKIPPLNPVVLPQRHVTTPSIGTIMPSYAPRGRFHPWSSASWPPLLMSPLAPQCSIASPIAGFCFSC